jgi:hypothetical protein
LKRSYNFIITLVLLILSAVFLTEAINSAGEFTKIGFDIQYNITPGDNITQQIDIDESIPKPVPGDSTGNCTIPCEDGIPSDIDIFNITGKTGTSYLRTSVARAQRFSRFMKYEHVAILH